MGGCKNGVFFVLLQKMGGLGDLERGGCPDLERGCKDGEETDTEKNTGLVF
jgi:hypothetical protein